MRAIQPLVGGGAEPDWTAGCPAAAYRVMPCAVGPNAAELLAGARASAMIEEMSHRYGDRMIVFSAPSGQAAKEVSMLAHYAGQAVVAVTAGTDRPALDDTLRLVRACAHAEVVSVG